MAKPKYKKIIDDIVNDIQEGRLVPNDKLPSQRSLSHKYDVNRSTVVQALDILKSYGIIATSEKKGVYVSNQSWNSLISNNMKWQDFIGNNASKNNLYYVQKINELEFADNMIRMGTGELAPDLIPNQKFKQILSKGNLQLTTNYEEAKGKLELRQAIVDYMKYKGVVCSVDEICITSGALQGLKLIAEGLLVPQSNIIIETPSYIHSVRTWNNISASIKPLHIDYIKRHINNIFKANSNYYNSIFYCIPTLHNPTQHSYSEQEKQKIINQCQQNGIPIVEDDIYGDLWFGDTRPQPMKSLPNSENVIYLGSLSKTVSPGLRIGWIVANKHIVKHLADLKMQSDYGASSISQYIAQQWLSQPQFHEQHVTQLKTILLEKRNLLLAAMAKFLADLGEWNKPQGSFYVWFKLNLPIDMKQLFNMATEAGLIIHPGEIYDRQAQQYIRFSYSYINKDDIEPAFDKLRQLILKLL